MKRRSIIIDTDSGIDDAAAITLALQSDYFDVKLLSTVAANVDVTKTTLNALKLVEFLGADVPVAKGAAQPILRKLRNSADIHGESGMDGYDFPPVTRKPLPVHAVEAMRKIILESQEKVTLVPIGALTNIALLFLLYPEVKDNIDELVMMGGGIYRGNMNSVSEFNIYIDPHAAAVVFQSGVKIHMLGLDVTEKALLHKDAAIKVKDSGKSGEMLYSLFEKYRGGSMETGLMIHDACTIAYMLHPEFFTEEEKYIEVALEGPAAGALVTSTAFHAYGEKAPNVSVCMDVDAEKFEAWFVQEFYK